MPLVIGYVYGYMWSEGEVHPYELVDAGIYITSPYRRMNINLYCTVECSGMVMRLDWFVLPLFLLPD